MQQNKNNNNKSAVQQVRNLDSHKHNTTNMVLP